MKPLTLVSLLVLMPALVAFVGCSSGDDDTPTGSYLADGDTTSAVFRFIDSTLNGEDVLDELGVALDVSITLFESLPGAPASSARTGGTSSMESLAAQDSIEVHNVSSWSWSAQNWLIINFSATFTQYNEFDTTEVTLEGVDSIQFLFDSVVLDSASMWNDSGYNGIRVRLHAQADGTDGSNSFVGGAHRVLELIGGHNGNDSLALVNAEANDTLTFDLSNDSGTCTIEIADHPTVSNLVANLEVEEDCPRAGVIARTAVLDLMCASHDGLDQLNLDGRWDARMTFNGDGTVTFWYSDRNTQWTTTRECADL